MLSPHADPGAAVPELTAYLKGELNGEARAAFEAHLPACERCRKAVAAVGTLFPGLAPPPPAPSLPSAAELLAQLDGELARARARNAKRGDRRRRNMLVGLAIVAVLLGIAAGGLLRLAYAP